MKTAEEFNAAAADKLPGHLGIVITRVGSGECVGELTIGAQHMAPNGFLHAGTVVTLADSTAGCGCLANLPEGGTGFTTIELKSNHLGTAHDGVIDSRATAVHMGRTTQVWDAVVTHRDTGKTLALFRCTQFIIYPRPG